MITIKQNNTTMSSPMESSLDAKLASSSAINEIFHIEHHVYEQRVLTIKSTDNRITVRLKPDDVGDNFKIRGLFLPSDAEYSRTAAVELWMGGFIINKIPMRLIQALNRVNDVPDYMDFSYDTFFSDCIHLHLVAHIMIVELRFVDMPNEVSNNIEVLFDCCWLNNKELARMKGVIIDNYFKHVMPCYLPGKPSNNLGIQTILVCERKDNIKSVKYDCQSNCGKTPVNVLHYNERGVGVYGIKITDRVTGFTTNPGKPWDVHYPEGNFNSSKFENEQLVVERKKNDGAPLDVYFLATNQLHYENGMAGPKFAW